MSLIYPLQQMLSDPLFIFEHMEPESASPSLIQAKELLNQAIEVYDSLDYENEKSLKLLEEADTLLKEESGTISKVYSNLALLLKAAIKKNRGEWSSANLLSDIALSSILLLFEEEDDVWSYFLKASMLHFIAQLDVIDFDYDYALRYYKKSVSFYVQALEWLSEHKEFISDPNFRITLMQKIFRSFQRLVKEMAELYYSQGEVEKALEYYQNVSKLGQTQDCQTFYQILLDGCPELKLAFDQLEDTDLKKGENLQDQLILASWQALLFLDQPDIDETIELLQTHFIQIALWQMNPKVREKMGQNTLDTLFFLPALLLSSPLFETIRHNTKDNQMAQAPEALYKELKERYLEDRFQSGQGNGLEKFALRQQSPREKELYSLFEQSLIQAESAQEKDEAQEKKALEMALLYCAALVNQSHVISDTKKYLLDFTKVYLRLGAYYERVEELEKAAEFYENAEYYLRTRDLADFEEVLRGLEQAYEALVRLYSQLGIQYKVNDYSWKKEKCTAQLEGLQS